MWSESRALSLRWHHAEQVNHIRFNVDDEKWCTENLFSILTPLNANKARLPERITFCATWDFRLADSSRYCSATILFCWCGDYRGRENNGNSSRFSGRLMLKRCFRWMAKNAELRTFYGKLGHWVLLNRGEQRPNVVTIGSKAGQLIRLTSAKFIRQFPQIQFPQLSFPNNYKVRGSTPINFEIQVNYELLVRVNKSPGLFPTPTPRFI